MTDTNLVERLRETSDDWPAVLVKLEQEAADRIESQDARIAELERECAELRRDAERYRWLVEHRGIAHMMGVRAAGISCPDSIEGCLVAHYAPIPKSAVDAAIDSAREKE